MQTPSLLRVNALLAALLVSACATPSQKDRSQQSHPSSPAVQRLQSPRLRLVGTTDPPPTTAGAQPPRVGWVYRIEGQLNGHPVQYVGSAADLKRRLTNEHEWAKLLQRDSTKVYALEVFAELDVQASNRQTPLSARNEALRAAEQRALEQARKLAEQTNLRRAPGVKRTKILNIDNAAADPTLWEARHKVRTGEAWRLLERTATSGTTKALLALSLLDAYLMYYDMKMSRYVMAPYILEDELGLFTLEQRTSLLASQHYKVYISGGTAGQKLAISSEEFRGLREEAEALWGTTDWKGDFVPGLLNRALPVISEQNGPL
jgi:hypothetical protein